MKHVKVTLTYEADYDDELTLDEIHERLEDYVDQELPMWIFGDEDDYKIELKLTQTISSTGANQIVTVQKTNVET
jgi:hypothetical protein